MVDDKAHCSLSAIYSGTGPIRRDNAMMLDDKAH